MKAQTTITSVSKTNTIILCCLISISIACIVGLLSKLNTHEFITNLLDWQNM